MRTAQLHREGSVPDWLALGFSLLLCLGTGMLGAAWTNQSIRDWYVTLEKPWWNPPNWVFGPVWTALYIVMAVAAWLVWRRRDRIDTKVPLALFALQLSFNCAWSGIFFALRHPGLAFLDIVLLWVAIVATILAFRRVSTLAAVMLLPYLAWVSFAAVLNGTLWRMNT